MRRGSPTPQSRQASPRTQSSYLAAGGQLHLSAAQPSACGPCSKYTHSSAHAANGRGAPAALAASLTLSMALSRVGSTRARRSRRGRRAARTQMLCGVLPRLRPRRTQLASAIPGAAASWTLPLVVRRRRAPRRRLSCRQLPGIPRRLAASVALLHGRRGGRRLRFLHRLQRVARGVEERPERQGRARPPPRSPGVAANARPTAARPRQPGVVPEVLAAPRAQGKPRRKPAGRRGQRLARQRGRRLLLGRPGRQAQAVAQAGVLGGQLARARLGRQQLRAQRLRLPPRRPAGPGVRRCRARGAAVHAGPA